MRVMMECREYSELQAAVEERAASDIKKMAEASTEVEKESKPLSEQLKSLSERAREEMGLWLHTLSYEDRHKLKMHLSPWGRSGGGNIIAVGLRRGKTARRNKKLKREREARLRAEHAAYEVRRALPASIESA